jgi:hypothetical protein
MQYTCGLRSILGASRIPAIVRLSALLIVVAAPAAAQTVVPVAPFRSVELHDGGHVILRHGATQRVTLLKGSTDCPHFTLADGDRLVIDKYKGRGIYQGQCPRGYELEIEIIMPDIAEIFVADGGTIESRGSFPRQAEIKTIVRNGGTIDIRTIVTDRVTASVEEGGRILTMPQVTLSASVASGGQITYWGDARIESSVRDGGTITKGTAAEADKPLSEFGPQVPPLPPVPPLRPIQPIRKLSWHQRSKARIIATEPVNAQENLKSRNILPGVEQER